MFGSAKKAAIAVLAAAVGCGSPDAPKIDAHAAREVRLVPQISGATVPINGAALTFWVDEEAERVHAAFSSPKSTVRICQSDRWVVCPADDWRRLAAEAAGDSIRIEVYTQNNGQWTAYAPLAVGVAADPIDPYLVYRLVAPGYALWGKLGIYERSTEGYGERSLIDNRSTEGGCMNCHTFADRSPDRMMLHLRKEKAGTIIVEGNQAKKVSLKQGPMYSEGVYASRHPKGRWIAYSVNDIRQHFPLTGAHATEVYDLRGDLVVYDTETEKITTNAAVFNDDFLYSMPEWGADGRWLYFTRTPKPAEARAKVRYDLYRIGFADGALADTAQLVWAASAEGLSVGRVAAVPGGRWLVAAAGEFGNFTVWHKEADLFLVDLASGAVRRAEELNSEWAESTPSVSSSGGWVVFSSRRADEGATTRPYIARFDTALGQFGRPYLLPQRERDFYVHRLESFNLPVFVKGQVNRRLLLDAID